MPVDRFQFDENGDTFCCFLVALLTVILLPLTYYVWPKVEKKDSNDSIKRRCQCQPCQSKRSSLRAGSTAKFLKRFFIKFSLLIAWAFLILLVFKLSTIQVENAAFDPFFELSIDKDASQSEIRKAYKQLSLIHHPDKGGDQQKFIRISKSYLALTDEQARKNWHEYGNPDGPEAVNFGIALPKWMIKKENTPLVVAVYALVFLLILPLGVGLWWYNTVRFSSTQVLLTTIRLYCGSFLYNPFMSMPRLIKLLSNSCEFNKRFNNEIACRPSDNVELHPLILQIPMFTIFKRAIVGSPYSIKAQSLIYAHMLRLELPPKTLAVDKDYIIKLCPRLFNEMISSLLCVLSIAMEDRSSRKKLPQLFATIENCMHLVPYLIQSLCLSSSSLMQLPHIDCLHFRHMNHSMRSIKSVRQFARLSEDKRRILFRNLTDEQYRDVINVCAGMPHIDIICSCEVLDDDDTSIWPVSIVTTTVRLIRRALLTPQGNSILPTTLSGGMALPTVVDASTDLRCSKDAAWYMGDESESSGLYYRSLASGRCADEPSSPPHDDTIFQEEEFPEVPARRSSVPVWDKSKRRRGPKKGKARKLERYQQQPSGQKRGKEKTPTSVKALTQAFNTVLEEVEADNREALEEFPLPDEEHYSRGGLNLAESHENHSSEGQKSKASDRTAEPKDTCTHTVHCPFFPLEKFEGWWVYLVDRKQRQLITKPVYVSTLQTEEELQLTFVAPPHPGSYLYTLCVRSDSYVDFDFFENLPFTVLPVPDTVMQCLKEAESRLGAESSCESSESEGSNDDEFGNEDDGYVEAASEDEDEDEDDVDGEEFASRDSWFSKKISLGRLSEYFARS